MNFYLKKIMKYKKSENKTLLKDMELTKISLVTNGESKENIWVVKDGDKCYLQNHAILFYPYPTWGLELDFANVIDVKNIRSESPETTILTIHTQAYEELSDFIQDDGEFLFEKYIEFVEEKQKEMIDKAQQN